MSKRAINFTWCSPRVCGTTLLHLDEHGVPLVVQKMQFNRNTFSWELQLFNGIHLKMPASLVNYSTDLMSIMDYPTQEQYALTWGVAQEYALMRLSLQVQPPVKKVQGHANTNTTLHLV